MMSPSVVSTWALMSPPSNGLAVTTRFIFIRPTDGTSGWGISSRMRLAASIHSVLRKGYCSATGPPDDGGLARRDRPYRPGGGGRLVPAYDDRPCPIASPGTTSPRSPTWPASSSATPSSTPTPSSSAPCSTTPPTSPPSISPTCPPPPTRYHSSTCCAPT